LPVVVTAQDVLAQIATDDGLAQGIAGIFAAMSATQAPPAPPALGTSGTFQPVTPASPGAALASALASMVAGGVLQNAITLWMNPPAAPGAAPTPAPPQPANPYFSTPNGAATLAAWTARYAGYLAWRSMTEDGLEGMTGGWFGVPQAGNQAIAWGLEFGAGQAGRVGWADIVNAIAAGKTPPKLAADPVSQQDVANANLAGLPGVPVPPTVVGGKPGTFELSTGTKWIAGGAVAALFLLALKK